ncbi:MAG: ACP S-malonyltransferase, partial [Actinomycetota bacterium]
MRAGLFPGQGIDAEVVLADLPEGHPIIVDASAILGYDLRRRVAQICRRVRPVLPTDVAQPAIFVAGLISFEAASAHESFAYLTGHSLGEYTALVAAESIPFTHGLQLVTARGKAMQRATLASSGAMAAVMGLNLEDIEAIAVATGTTVANDNSPTQVVLSGDESALARAAGIVRRRDGRSVLLPVEGAYHSPAMEPAVAHLAAALDQTDIRSPK